MPKEGAALTDEEIEALRSSPTWAERVELMHTLPREERVCETYAADPERFSGVSVPALLIKGELSPYAESVERAKAALPHSEVATLAGQGHAGIATAPEHFADELFRFLA